jgi:methylated-DNA-protein-cysteine methyltransferase-like protein
MVRTENEQKRENLNPFEQVYEIVRMIPRGKVFTYGLISKRMNRRLSAAAVGWAMNALGSDGETGYTSKNVPWHRVINSKGTISTHHESAVLAKTGRPVKLQQILLEQEGIIFAEDGSVDLKHFLWREDVE